MKENDTEVKNSEFFDPYPLPENPFKIYKNNEKIESILNLVNSRRNRHNFSSQNLRFQSQISKKDDLSLPNIKKISKSNPIKRKRKDSSDDEGSEKFSNYTYKMNKSKRKSVKVEKIIKMILTREEKIKKKSWDRDKTRNRILNETLKIRKGVGYLPSLNFIKNSSMGVKLKPKHDQLQCILEKIRSDHLVLKSKKLIKKNINL